MEAPIKKLDSFPVTVIDAVAVGDGTSDMLKDYLGKNYIKTAGGEAGQLPVSNGDGTVTWTTIANAEEVEF